MNWPAREGGKNLRLSNDVGIGIFASLIQPRRFGNIKVIDKLQGMILLAFLRKGFGKDIGYLLQGRHVDHSKEASFELWL